MPRNPNGYGGIKKLSGKRKRPFAVYVTTDMQIAPSVPKIDFLSDILTPDLYLEVEKQYNAYKAKQPLKAKQVQKCIGYYETRPEAMIALAEYNKNPFDIDKQNITFSQVYDSLYESKFKNMKVSAKRSYTSAYQKCTTIKNMRMKEIRLAHLQGVVDEYSDKSVATQNNIIVLFHAIYNFCLENDICEKDYSQFVKTTSTAEKKDKKPFTKEEIQTVWNNLDWIQESKYSASLTDMPMMDSIIIMLYTGVRIGELLELKPSDIHIDERWIDLRGTKTKAARRIVPIHKKIIPLLKKRMSESKGDYLFHDKNGKHLSYAKYRNSFYNLFSEQFKIERTPHECRHTFATIATASGMNPVLKKKIIGHASADITDDVYTHAYIEDLIKEIDKFDL